MVKCKEKNRTYLLVILLLVVFSSRLLSNNNILINKDFKVLNISEKVLFYIDSTNQQTINDISSKKFSASSKSVINFGMSSSAYWIKIPCKNKSSIENFLLEIEQSTLDRIDLYTPLPNGKFNVVSMGKDFVFNHRIFHDPDFVFNIFLPKNTEMNYYLRVKSKLPIQLPMILGVKEDIFNQIKKRDILSGIYFGIMLAMIFYNLFIYFSVKDKSYIYYVVYIILILLTQTSLQGYPFQYLWPSFPKIEQYSLFLLPSLVSMSGIIFMNVFLRVKTYNFNLFKISFFLFLPYILSIIFSFTQHYELSYKLMEFGSVFTSIFMLITSLYIIKRGYYPARYFLAAWSVFLVGVIIYILKDFEILPFNNFTRYTMQIGSGIETILLSFALAARINIYKKEKEQAQLNEIKALEENEQLIKEQNVILEQKVVERTNDLNITLKNLKLAQIQLVDAEKMASLGQLTAGIAHEVNNPINFITSNIFPLREDIKDLKAILSKYAEINTTSNLTEKLAEIEALKEELQYDYLLDELEGIIHGIEDGAKRTAEIVSGLRNFSRLDESDLKLANINDGINATLKLIKSKFGNIQLIKKLGNIPEIECYPGKLNQLFLNLIDNAIFAVKAKALKPKEGKITIETVLENNFLVVKISDNGTGMNPATKDKIFEPFFTTKKVGEGTGLGLAIVHGIIETHNAKIEVNTEEGIGTEFILKLEKF